MEHILNLEYSLKSVLRLVEIQVKEGSEAAMIRFIGKIPFCDGDSYKKEVYELLIKHDNKILRNILQCHFDLCNQIRSIWYDSRNNLKYDPDMVIFFTFSKFEIEEYCIVKDENTALLFKDEIERYSMNGKIFMMSSVIDFVDGAFRFLYEYCTDSCDNPDLIHFPDHILISLQDPIWPNKKPFIEDSKARPLKWMQSDQYLRDLVTHDKIRGKITKQEMLRRASVMFVNKSGMKFKFIGGNKHRDTNIYQCLSKILATL